MVKKANEEIRRQVRFYGLRYWEVAKEMGVAEDTLFRWLREELNEKRKTRIENALINLTNGEYKKSEDNTISTINEKLCERINKSKNDIYILSAFNFFVEYIKPIDVESAEIINDLYQELREEFRKSANKKQREFLTSRGMEILKELEE